MPSIVSHFRYHRLKCAAWCFEWLASILRESDPPRMLMFFTSVDVLSTAYSEIVELIGQERGALHPRVRMYHSSTNPEIKRDTVDDMNNEAGTTR